MPWTSWRSCPAISRRAWIRTRWFSTNRFSKGLFTRCRCPRTHAAASRRAWLSSRSIPSNSARIGPCRRGSSRGRISESVTFAVGEGSSRKEELMPLPFSRTLTPDQTSRLTWPETSRRSGSTNGVFRARSARCPRCHGRSCSRHAARTWHPSKPLEFASLIRMLPPVKELSSGILHLKIFRAALKTGHLPTTECIDAVDFSRTARNLKPEARLRRDSGTRDPGPIDAVPARRIQQHPLVGCSLTPVSPSESTRAMLEQNQLGRCSNSACLIGITSMHISVLNVKLMRVALAAFTLSLIGSSLVPGRAGEFKLGDRTLKVPAGFTIEPVAGPPLVDRPITTAFDEEGRLYIADSSGSNDNVQKQLAGRPHRIVRVDHARWARPATQRPGAGRPGCVSQGLPLNPSVK